MSKNDEDLIVAARSVGGAEVPTEEVAAGYLKVGKGAKGKTNRFMGNLLDKQMIWITKIDGFGWSERRNYL